VSKALQDKTAVITGGATGIGLATAQRFIAEGARVFITGRRQTVLDDAVTGLGDGAEAVRADSSNLSDLDELYATIRERAGTLDIVVANSGGGTLAPLGQITEEQVDSALATNVKGVIFSVQKALPLLNPRASIILIASTTTTKIGVAGQSVYGASKAAVRNLARGWARDLAGRGIRVNAISPGPTRTPGLLEGFPGAEDEVLALMAADVPLGRTAEPEEIAAAALFLASDDASFVNGVEFYVDGGQAQV
jgi:NAD(P)-dependent dehydrogenase (short-subunit alcohol dehydrogenase family)